jgi:transcriptional regulator with XRE-family HTH domain
MIGRIQKILNSKNLSPSLFADRIGVQRSAVSHILSGRNKPSLDFIMKILTAFPDIDADWLLFGRGELKNEKTADKPVESKKSEIIEKVPVPNNKPKEIIYPPDNISDHAKISAEGQIVKVVLLYHDNTFHEYNIRKHE